MAERAKTGAWSGAHEAAEPVPVSPAWWRDVLRPAEVSSFEGQLFSALAAEKHPAAEQPTEAASPERCKRNWLTLPEFERFCSIAIHPLGLGSDAASLAFGRWVAVPVASSAPGSAADLTTSPALQAAPSLDPPCPELEGARVVVGGEKGGVWDVPWPGLRVARTGAPRG